MDDGYESYGGYERYEDEWISALRYPDQDLYRQIDLGFYIMGASHLKP
jgi:hypothetical protein